MNVEILKKQVGELIGEAKTKEALQLLKNHLKQNTEAYNTLLLLSNRYKHLSLIEMQGIEDPKTLTTERNKINKNLLDLKIILEEQDFTEKLDKSIHQILQESRILILSNQENHANLSKYFSKLPFNGHSICTYDKIPDLSAFSLVVYDNRDLPSNRKGLTEEQQKVTDNRTNLMENCIKQNPAAIHFGGYLEWLDKNRNKAYSANYEFALFARIKEMLELLDALK